ncbi:uncharacterized protein J3D65DRAFT_1128 [Phyllosticta citribraziliensis]|uniref:BHLH domain-containing protein n=1 Tax=Phyllosticta citribraziliensis TaxID=989973 RepID=A0ABR1M7Z3_9PEZI
MLALVNQPPASHFGMSSNQVPGKDENIYGYHYTDPKVLDETAYKMMGNFPGDVDYAAAAENVQAPGPGLLNDLQFGQLQDFFDQGPFNQGSNNFTFSDHDFGPSNHHPTDSFGGFNFMDSAPTFHGTVTEPSHNAAMFGHIDHHPVNHYMQPRNGSMQTRASDEVIGAATALMSSSQPHDMTFLSKPHPTSMPGASLPSPPASAPFTSTADHHHTNAPATSADDGAPTTVLNFFTMGRSVAPSQSHPYYGTTSVPVRPRPPPQFGSDTNFNNNGFRPDSKTTQTEDAIVRRLVSDMQVLQPAGSGPSTQPNTQPPSPTLQKRAPLSYHDANHVKQPTNRKRMLVDLMPIDPGAPVSDGGDSTSENASPGGGPIKRRRTLAENGLIPTARLGSSTPTSAGGQRAASFSVGPRNAKRLRDSGAESPVKKGKVSQKERRENLSEEQKRSNHILSEQKRRNAIKVGFGALNELVPGLKAGGFSKSAMLIEAAKFLENLVVGNQMLRQALGET